MYNKPNSDCSRDIILVASIAGSVSFCLGILICFCIFCTYIRYKNKLEPPPPVFVPDDQEINNTEDECPEPDIEGHGFNSEFGVGWINTKMLSTSLPAFLSDFSPQVDDGGIRDNSYDNPGFTNTEIFLPDETTEKDTDGRKRNHIKSQNKSDKRDKTLQKLVAEISLHTFPPSCQPLSIHKLNRLANSKKTCLCRPPGMHRRKLKKKTSSL